MLRVWRMWVGGAEQAEPEVTEQLHKKEVRASTIERHSSMRVMGCWVKVTGLAAYNDKLYSCSADSTVKVVLLEQAVYWVTYLVLQEWEMSNWECTATYEGHCGEVSSLAIGVRHALSI